MPALPPTPPPAPPPKPALPPVPAELSQTQSLIRASSSKSHVQPAPSSRQSAETSVPSLQNVIALPRQEPTSVRLPQLWFVAPAVAPLAAPTPPLAPPDPALPKRDRLALRSAPELLSSQAVESTMTSQAPRRRRRSALTGSS